jgi:uncharacterized protein with HEPN domain
MQGLRDTLIHGHDTVDSAKVWRPADRDVPGILRWLETRLPKAE